MTSSQTRRSRILYLFNDKGPITARGLAPLVKTDITTLNNDLRELERLKVVERIPLGYRAHNKGCKFAWKGRAL